MRRKLAIMLILAGALLFMAPAWMAVEGAYNQYRLRAEWEAAWAHWRAATARQATQALRAAKAPGVRKSQAQPASGPAATRHTPAVVRTRAARPPRPTVGASRIRGFPPTQIAIPSIGLKAIVVEGVSSSALRRGPGHFPRTAGPGMPGNCCIAAHRNMYGSWFRRLNRLGAGDIVTLRTPGSVFRYRVTRRYETHPKSMGVLAPTRTPTLTLITCAPVPRPTRRLIVRAELLVARPDPKTGSAVL